MTELNVFPYLYMTAERTRKMKTESPFLRFVSSKTVRENLLLIFTGAANRLSFPSSESKTSRNRGEELLVGTYAVGTMAYHAHKARVGQTRYRTMMEHWNHH